VLVNGASGAGKSTLARAVGSRPDLGRAGRPLPRVTEWPYGHARPLLLARCDLLVWLDLRRRVSAWTVTRRTWPVVDVQRARPDLPVVRLRSAAEAESWLDRLRRAGRGGTPGPPR
jgi:hypothetical protein